MMKLVKHEDSVTLHLEIPINLYNVDMIRDNFLSIIDEQKFLNIILDLTKVDYIDTFGLSLLILMKTKSELRDCLFQLLNPNKIIVNKINVSGYQNFFQIENNIVNSIDIENKNLNLVF